MLMKRHLRVPGSRCKDFCVARSGSRRSMLQLLWALNPAVPSRVLDADAGKGNRAPNRVTGRRKEDRAF